MVVPGIAALYEFVVKGRKRLGYRVQMDTTASNVVKTQHDGPFAQLVVGTRKLEDPTIVLLRIENNGATNIDEGDYSRSHADDTGITVTFTDRNVVGAVVTEVSDTNMGSSFQNGGGFTVTENVLELPKVPMNRGEHYKVLLALERADGGKGPRQYPPPDVDCTVKGGVGGGRIQETKSRTGTPKRVLAMIGFLVAIVVAQLVIFASSGDSAPLDCASGHLRLTGSTAFEPVAREAAKSYHDLCPRASFTLEMRGSGEGLQTVDQAGRDGSATDRLTFSDGEKPTGMPGLLPRPIAFFLFTLVVNGDAGIQDLTLDQIKQIYQGKITNWQEIGGNNLPIRLISRNPGSGTRAAFQRRVLAGEREPGSNSDDCQTRDPGSPAGVVRCARDTTDAVLRTVASTPGALGYSELSAATGRNGLISTRINGHAATVEDADHGTYPFWETEFGYTYGEPPANSLAASFLRYLTNQTGADIIRSHGDRPCAELANPQLCHPT
ncbi:substrate-binding domain-containing protein [Paractinoplanes durhamensis]|uniref:substrate-binding domain-containing protein n=1 Tax=Paractinoplanes durhamensis TaxID=113563 RepID=UPI0019428CA0|nr:substrate-binding domain-containing protein [Actinoplanes durhamensis]